eukprot:scaffold263623_cov21-Prasinocladus_malaysianus.AAC.1
MALEYYNAIKQNLMQRQIGRRMPVNLSKSTSQAKHITQCAATGRLSVPTCCLVVPQKIRG